MVGGLVEQQHIGVLQEEPAQSDPAPFTTAEQSDFVVFRRTAECVHGHGQLVVEVPAAECFNLVLHGSLAVHEGLHLIGVVEDFLLTEFEVDLFVFFQCIGDGLHAFFHNFADGLVVVQLRLLGQVTDRIAWTPYDFALVTLVESGNDPHDG